MRISHDAARRRLSQFAIHHRERHCLGGLIWLLLAAAVAGDAAARDVETRMHPLTYTAPVSKAEYLGGRFLAAFVLNALMLLAVPAGILLAFALAGLEPEIIGPFRPAGLPQRLLLHGVAERLRRNGAPVLSGCSSRRAIASYLASVLLFVTS